MTNINRNRGQKIANNSPGLSMLVSIEPYRLWTIKVLKRFAIISKEEASNLLEQYLDSLNKLKVKINKRSEKESDEYVVTLDPLKWKDQDHYMVLGLQHIRYKATEDDIKRAHRRKALKHHPDKRGKTGEDMESDYYACITRAIEVLGDPVKRRSYDSVDPTFDDNIPNLIKQAKLEQDKGLFFRTFGPVFESNCRWSLKQHVPQLGNENSPREQVERFYEFWYNFQSWRDFSYLDEEDKEKGENRDERRWLDRQNKAARQQRKKAENQRIRQLVDNAYNCDPRISKFKDEDKQRKLDMKRAKKEEVRMRQEREESERIQKEKEENVKKVALEEEEKRKKLEEKRQKDQVKRDIKKAVKGIEEIFKANEYFVNSPRDKLKHIEELDKLMKTLSLGEIRNLKEQFENSKEFSERQTIFLGRINSMNEKSELERVSDMTNKNHQHDTNSSLTKDKTPQWTEDEIKLLVKSVSMFAAGTKDRWEVIAQYMAQHSNNQIRRDAKQVLSKVKQIQEQLAKRRP